MLLVVRISGDVNLNEEIRQALFRFRLRRKYVAVLIKPTEQNMKLLKILRNHVAYGDVDPQLLKELIDKRGQPIDKSKKIKSEEIISNLGKRELSDLGIKPFFRLHPPRGGIESKKHFGVGKGVLGDNKKNINDLVRRML